MNMNNKFYFILIVIILTFFTIGMVISRNNVTYTDTTDTTEFYTNNDYSVITVTDLIY